MDETQQNLLLVEENNGLWFYPAGHVDPDETFAEAGRRETMEEASVEVAALFVLHIFYFCDILKPK